MAIQETAIKEQKATQLDVKRVAAVVERFSWGCNQDACMQCIESLVSALRDDPLNTFFAGKRSTSYVKDELAGYLKALPRATHFITVANKAVAMWHLYPDEIPVNELMAGWQRFFKVPPKLWPCMVGLELAFERHHEAIFDKHGQFYYLSYFGTHPDCQGKGYGSLLLGFITAKADAEQRFCYLEATSERSRRLYERHGFVLQESFRYKASLPTMYLMLRPPQLPSKQPIPRLRMGELVGYQHEHEHEQQQQQQQQHGGEIKAVVSPMQLVSAA